MQSHILKKDYVECQDFNCNVQKGILKSGNTSKSIPNKRRDFNSVVPQMSICNLASRFSQKGGETGEEEYKKKFTVDLLINNCNLSFQIDSGASISAICEKVYVNKLSNYKLKKDDTILKSYDNNVLYRF